MLDAWSGQMDPREVEDILNSFKYTTWNSMEYMNNDLSSPTPLNSANFDQDDAIAKYIPNRTNWGGRDSGYNEYQRWGYKSKRTGRYRITDNNQWWWWCDSGGSVDDTFADNAVSTSINHRLPEIEAYLVDDDELVYDATRVSIILDKAWWKQHQKFLICGLMPALIVAVVVATVLGVTFNLQQYRWE